MTAREGNTDTGTAGSDQDSTVTDGKETGKPFPEELKGTKIYDKITEESVPYNEDGDGTEEKPYRYLCAPGVTVHAQFMLKVLENREICTFEVVDDKDNPTRILYEWTLDGKNGQIIKPVQPDQPDTPSEPNSFVLSNVLKSTMISSFSELTDFPHITAGTTTSAL